MDSGEAKTTENTENMRIAAGGVNVSENIKRVRDAIAEAAIRSGRSPGDVTLVAAAKTKPAELVMEAIAAGADAIGENRVQEMMAKRGLGAYEGAPLHFIGRLQSNKAARIVGVCDLIESVSSPALIELIGKTAASRGVTQNVLLEVNIGKEPQKAGFAPDRLEEAMELASRTEGVNVMGLMSVPPLYEQSDRNCNYFEAIFQLFIDMTGKKYDNVSMRFLSMGMSDSFTEAIFAGSNMVRVGSAIFGAR